MNTSSTSSSKFDVLLVEDDPHLCAMLAEILEFHGYVVETARDGESGFRKISEIKPRLVISDIFMPDTDGFELLTLWRTLSNPPPIIVISGSLTGDIEVSLRVAKCLGAATTLAKPFSMQQLIDAVRAEIGEPASSLQAPPS